MQGWGSKHQAGVGDKSDRQALTTGQQSRHLFLQGDELSQDSVPSLSYLWMGRQGEELATVGNGAGSP